MIPENIKKKHLEKALKEIDRNGIRKGRHSSTYDLIHNGKSYPPKLVISIANRFANGTELDSDVFSGGKGTPAFELLESEGFEIVPKNMGYYNQLDQFLKQAKTDNLKVKHFKSNYSGTKVKVSFGQGVAARIPWISFLVMPFTTSNGIYPVYLYYKSIDKLVLAYGVSETSQPTKEWEIINKVKIKEYFLKNKLGKPDRYGESFVFKTYDTDNLPNAEKLNDDLDDIIAQYLIISREIQKPTMSKSKFTTSDFHRNCQSANIYYSSQLLSRFAGSLVTKPFVILSGLSGSGKTKLAQSFSQWLCEDKTQYCIVPVGADWTNREPLLGYVNALDSNQYILPENGALQLMIEANGHPDKPYFLILDEMNLSHVERYFADFLSIMESKDNFKLHSDEGNTKSGVPHELAWPKNLFVVGTVNIDETTYMFSPKVLDRANVIEFRVDSDDMKAFLSDSKEVTELNGEGSSMGESFVSIAKSIEKTNSTKLTDVLASFFVDLQLVGAEFGYRTASEIQTLFSKIDLVSGEYSIAEDDKIDIAIMQKLLPKLHGSRRKLLKTLELLAQKCLEKPQENLYNERGQFNVSEENSIKYKLSFEKISRMYKNAIENGFASYAEA